MERPRSSVFTRTREVHVRELDLVEDEERRPPAQRRESGRSEHIRERLRRWLDQEL